MAGKVKINTNAEVQGEDQPPKPTDITVAFMDYIRLGFSHRVQLKVR